MRQRPSPTLLGRDKRPFLAGLEARGDRQRAAVARELPRYASWELGRAFHISRRGKENGAQTKKFQPFQATAQNSLQTGCRSRCKFKREIARPALPGQRFPVSVMMAPMKEQQNRGSHENRQGPPAELTRPRASLLAIAHIGKARLAMGV